MWKKNHPSRAQFLTFFEQPFCWLSFADSLAPDDFYPDDFYSLGRECFPALKKQPSLPPFFMLGPAPSFDLKKKQSPSREITRFLPNLFSHVRRLGTALVSLGTGALMCVLWADGVQMHVGKAAVVSMQPWCLSLSFVNKRAVFLLRIHKHNSLMESKLWSVWPQSSSGLGNPHARVHTRDKGPFPLLKELVALYRECVVIGRNAGWCKYHIVPS